MATINGVEVDNDSELLDIPEIADTPMSPQVGMAALALNFALKYHDINTVQEGALYQQYKLEGKNLRPLMLDEVLYTAGRIEQHLLQTPSRLALAIIEMAVEDMDAALDEEDDAQAIEARRAETGEDTGSVEDESAVPEGNAPTPEDHP